ncbi:Ig-like domain-containing protein [Fluviicola taffensis]|uniref:Ig domain protein group 2 domain protein n=1 Tax=Fluviicola taffensis (strain DSM 16823 / NCIMB 13979 / RW262) TaxID=755732 RepID=F2IC80_FLUTR|nr:Ig-like domain-containing protein [Fluviicola taffensis]AEA44326.1 Ig domain protein group 2 domain protein [Fluviicola taffensis DSM 16823]
MKTTIFWGYFLFPLFTLLGLSAFSQGSDTQAGATGVPVTLPFAATGSTVSATNNYDIGGTTVDDGPDWFYYHCATSNATIWVTITFTPNITNPVLPSITILDATGVTLLGQTQIFGDNSGTYGIPYTPTAGQCYYFVIDNDGATGGFNYNISMSNTVPPHPANPTQPACTNIGFDAASTAGWLGSWGHSMQTGVSPQPTPTYTPIFYNTTGGHHTITTPGIDIQAPIQKVCPQIPGNTNSLLLGDGPNGAYGGASIEQKFQVTASNALFIYYYALVIQDGGAAGGGSTTAHTDQEQPYFKIDALDCGGVPIACGNLLVTGGPGIPGFTQLGTSGIYWKDWTAVMLDLTPYIGSCVTMRFTLGDCSIGAHYAYAYLDATCGPMSIVAPPTICQFQTSTLTAPAGAATYSWVETSAPGTVLGTANTLSVTPTTTGTFNYQCTMTSVAGCSSTLTTSVTVLPSPQITVTNPASVCSPGTVNLTSAGVVTINSGTGTIGYFSDAACTIPIASPSAISVSGTYYIRILNANGCFEIEPVTVVVNASPTADVTTLDQAICPGASVNLNATLTPAGYNNPVTFTNTTDFSLNDGSVTPINSPITVTGITPQTAGVLPIVSVNLNIPHTYVGDVTVWLRCPNGSTIELTSDNGGAGQNYTNTTFVPTGSPSITTGTAPFTGSFTPEQAFSLLNSCAVNGVWTLQVYDLGVGDVGTLTDWSITFNNFVPPTFVWSPTTNMTNSTTLTPTVAPTTTTIYTLTGTNSIGGCTSTDQVTITVNPLPTATISGTTTVCQNATAPTVTFTGANGIAPYTFTYNINGGANQTVSSGAGVTATVTAPTTVSGTFTYNLVSVTSAMGCSQNQPGTAVITVNPIPTVNAPAPQTVCANTSTTAVTFTGNNTAITTFDWTNNSTSIGLGANGTGNIASFTGTNATASPITATITVTPTLNTCVGTPQNFTITVNPTPTVNAPTPQTVCANTSTTPVVFTGNNTATTTFNWTNNTTSIGLGANGTGTIGAFTATNGTAAPVVATITVTPTLNVCSGTPQNFTITVNPIPTVNAPTPQTICANTSTTAVTFTGNNTATTTFDWTNNTTSIGLVANGTGNIASFTGTNATASPVTATITVTPTLNTCVGTSQNFTITVNPIPTVNVPTPQTICANTSATTVTFTGNNTATTTFNWTNNNTSIGLGANGTGNIGSFTATNATATPVTATITVTPTLNGCVGISQNFSITVNPAPTIGGTFTVCAGSTTQLTGSGTPALATPWTSSNTAIATISTTGLVAGVNPGTSTITYTNSDGCSITQAVTITSGATITGTLNVCTGSTTQLTGSGTPATTSPWSSSNNAVATVSNTGLVTGISAGTTTITYTNSTGCLDNEVLTVNPLPTITGSDVCIGATTQLTASGTANATNPWVSSNPTIATISATGLVNGISAGSAVMTYTNSNGCSNTMTLNVLGLPVISGTLNACIGATTQLSATGTPNITNPWASSNTGVATVSNTGLVTGVSAGTTTITYTNSGSCQTTTVVTINSLPTITGTLSVCAGLTTQLTGSGTANTTNPWTSSNTSVATISNTGLVTGVSAGTATITYLNNNACSQTASITVNALPTAAIAGASTICAGSSTTFTISGTPNATVIYSNGTVNSNVVLNAAGNATVNTGVLNATTTYTLVSAQSATPASCTNTLTGSIVVTVNPIPVMNPVANTVVCPGDNVTIPAFTSNPAGATYAWTNTNTATGLGASGSGDIPNFVGVNPGTTPISGTITVIPTLNGCSGLAVTFTIGVSNNPAANAGVDLSLCINSTSGNQIGSPAVVGNTYSWNPATDLSDATISNPTVNTTVQGTTQYTVTVTNTLGCESTDQVSITIHPLPAVSFQASSDEGCAPVSITFTNDDPTNSVNCVWTIPGVGTQVGCGSITQQFNTAGVFDVSLTITDANGCVNSMTNSGMITIYPEVDASFGVNVLEQSILNPVFQLTNNSTNATAYLWEFGDGTTSTQTNPTHTYTETPGVYRIYLYASNPAGCNDSAVIVVSVIDELIFYIPNTFTPDGDEFNNTFFPVFSSGFDAQNYTLLIFDRWGEIIFESHDVDFGWDGTYIGQLCKEGVYTWKITIKERNKDKHHEYVGHVNLLK